MSRVVGILIVGILGALGCEAQAPGTEGNGEAVAAAGLAAPGLSSTAAFTEQESADIVVRRVWGRQNVDLSGDVSYDGRELVFVDYDTGDLAVRDLRTGEIRKLTDKGSWEESGEYGMTPKMSRDGRQVAYTWALPSGNSERYELRIIGMDGTGLRTLYRDESVGWINAVSWSPDGAHVLASVIRQGDTRQILQITVPDGASRILKTTGPEPLGQMSFSPDGRFVVFDRVVDEGSENRDIYLMAADGSREVRIVEHPAIDFVLGWAPDGEQILFASDRQGTLGAWLLRLVDGEPSGAPVLVRPDMWRMTPLGFTRDGSYYYGVSTTRRTVYVASLDPVTGNLLTGPTPVSQPPIGSTMDRRPCWSPDGRFLAFQSNRVTGGVEQPAIILQSMETGETREVTPRGANWVAPGLWSRDGRYILGFGRDVDSRRDGFFKVDVLTGETQPFPNFWGVNMAGPLGLSHDGLSLYYKAWLDDGAGVAVRGLEGGMGEMLYHWRGSSFQIAELSPDGQRVAFGEEDGGGGMLYLMPASGGAPEVLVQFPPGAGGPEQIVWTPDGERVIYRNGGEIWSVSRIGGEPRKLEWPIEGSLMTGMRDIQISPDGRRIAFVAEAGEEELWVMENFIPGH
ncbi:MAG: hypothetical protein ABIF09_16090 [Gemmatimonadota bacterium]